MKTVNNLIFLDTETTDNTEDCKLVQLAYIVNDNEPVNELYNPAEQINFEAMAVHHITQKMVADKPAFKDSPQFAELKELLPDSVLIAHNAQFDVGVLTREGLIVDNRICTLKVAMALLDEPSYKLQVLRYKYNLNVEGAVAHDALGDIIILEKLFTFLHDIAIKQVPLGSFEDFVNWAIEITRQPALLRNISFGKHKGTPFNEIPKDYLRWLKGQSDLDENMKHTVNYWLNK